MSTLVDSKKALYLHGFLGSPDDMTPLYLEGYDCESYDLRKILFKDDPVTFLSEDIGQYEFILGYSFGGRILEELKDKFPKKARKYFFTSSRHTPYPDDEMGKRNVFRNKLYGKLENLPNFFEHWRGLSLFGGHQMDEYRSKHKLAYTPWTFEEIERYLDLFFTSRQCQPVESRDVHFFHGDLDLKYSKEGERLKGIFNVHTVKGGHRFLFENPAGFKETLKGFLK